MSLSFSAHEIEYVSNSLKIGFSKMEFEQQKSVLEKIDNVFSTFSRTISPAEIKHNEKILVLLSSRVNCHFFAGNSRRRRRKAGSVKRAVEKLLL